MVSLFFAFEAIPGGAQENVCQEPGVGLLQGSIFIFVSYLGISPLILLHQYSSLSYFEHNTFLIYSVCYELYLNIHFFWK